MSAGVDIDVVVVGAGLAGGSTALHLARLRPQLRVWLLDAACPAAGASGRGTGLLGPRFGPPVDVARRRFGDAAARSLFERSVRAVRDVMALAARVAPEAVSECEGQLVTGFTQAEQAAVHRRAFAYRELGLDVPLIAAEHRAWPAAPDRPALLYRTAAGVDPAALTRGLARAAVAAGVHLLDDTTVLSFEPAPHRRTRLRTSRGEVTARAVVVTVDAADPGLALPTVGLLGLEVCASATAVLRDDLLAELGGPRAAHVIGAKPLGGYRRITADGRLVVGGGPATAYRGLRDAALARRRNASWAWQRAWLDQIHPALREVPVEHHWSGRITITADGLPVLGRVPGDGEIWYAGGWNGHGLAATVSAGQRLAEVVLSHPDGRGGRGQATLSDGSPLWRPARPWPLAAPALTPVVRGYLATQVPSPQGAPMSITAALRKPLEQVEASLRLPTGRLGTAVGHAMSVQHRSLTRWALRQLDPRPDADVLDLGCGSGMALRLVSQRNTSGRLAGVDLSPTMVELTRRTNAGLPAHRFDVRVGDAMALPFDDDSFDVVTATETLYFWPDAMRGLAECRRVLRPGGWLAVTLEMTRDAADDPTLLQRVFGSRFTDRSDAEGLRILSGTELSAMVTAAGFTRVRFVVEPRRSLGWLCVTGQVAPSEPDVATLPVKAEEYAR